MSNWDFIVYFVTSTFTMSVICNCFADFEFARVALTHVVLNALDLIKLYIICINKLLLLIGMKQFQFFCNSEFIAIKQVDTEEEANDKVRYRFLCFLTFCVNLYILVVYIIVHS